MNCKNIKLNINAVGNWNIKIFNPQWIIKNLLKDIKNKGPINVSGIINANTLELSYTLDEITLTPNPNFLRIDFNNKNKNPHFCLNYLY